jgi:peptidoglycan DL-endopeptidase CwlO
VSAEVLGSITNRRRCRILRSTLNRKFAVLISALSVTSILWATAVPATIASPRLDTKQAEFNRIQAQVDKIDGQLDVVVEQYNSFNNDLIKTKTEIKRNTDSLRVSEEKFAETQQQLNRRFAAVYRTGGVSYISVLINTKSLDEFLDYLEIIKRRSKTDHELMGQLRKTQQDLTVQRAQLIEKEKKQSVLLSQIVEKKQKINGELKSRSALLSKIGKEIKQQQLAEMVKQKKLRKKLKVSFLAVSRVSVSRGGGRSSAVQLAMDELGKPYSWGADGPGSFDCSGLTMHVYGKLGISLPHSSRAQYECGQHVDRDQLQPGDLVFFARGSTISHVGIYAGGGSYIHAPQTGDVVKVSDLSSHGGYVGAIRP